MSTTPSSGSSLDRLIDSLAQKRPLLAGGAAILGVVLGIIPIYAMVRHGREAVGVIVWGCFLALFLILSAVFVQSPRRNSRLSDSDQVRFLILIVAAGIGFATVLLGLYLACFVDFYRNVLTSDLNEWRKQPGVLVKVGASVLGGLVLMFLGLLLAKNYERTHSTLRRLLYGYNAILSAVLLLFILFLVNVLSYSRWIRPLAAFGRTIDWTSTRVYSLSDSSTKFIRGVDQPIKVYVLLTQEGGSTLTDVETLLENLRSYNPRITATFLSRDRNAEEIRKLIAKYKIADPDGLLVVLDPEGANLSEFISRNDLSAVDMRGRPVFLGENMLIKTIDFLVSGKSKAVVYFTQGAGELSVTDRSDRKPDSGMGKLWDRLGEGNFELKEFKFGQDSMDDLKKADILVIAGGTNFAPPAVEALRNYLRGDGKKKGKLFVMLDATIRDGKMQPTGLEPLLLEHNVRVNDDMVLVPVPGWPDPREVLGIVAAFQDNTNPIVEAFGQDTFKFYQARTVVKAQTQPGPQQAKIEPLVIADPRLRAFSEPNLQADPSAVIAEFRRDVKKNVQAMQLSNVPRLAVAVSQSNQPPMNPHMPQPPQEGEPVMVVFGDASWVSNKYLTPNNENLFASCLSWLRGKADLGVKPSDAKTRNTYELPVLPDQLTRLIWLPGGVLLLSVIVLGGGVWIVRRR